MIKKMLRLISLISSLTLLTQTTFGSGSSGGSGGGSGASGGSSPKLESGIVNKIQREQEKKVLELQRAASGKNNLNFDHGHTIFNDILKKNVVVLRGGQASQVNYAQVNQAQLKIYLQNISSVTRSEFNSMSRDQKLAFLINAYNAFTISLIATNLPVKSIKDLGSLISSPWKKKFISLFGETISLDEIEHGMIRKDPQFQEPRIHFAVNCASIGCPPLLNEAITANKLSEQLQTATQNFLRDRERNRVDSNTVVISKIFDWYGEDFEKSWKGINSVKDFLATHAAFLADNPEQEKILKEKKYDLKYSEYDWNLNKTNK